MQLSYFSFIANFHSHRAVLFLKVSKFREQ